VSTNSATLVPSPAPLLGRVARFGLPGVAPEVTERPLRDVAFDALVDEAVEQHLTGHLLAALGEGAFAADADQAARAEVAHIAALAGDLLLERLLVRTSRRFAGAGIEHRVLKGPAFAHTVYADPALRSFGDIDVLVRAEDYDDAIASLVACGGEVRYEEPRPRFTKRFGKGVCVVVDDLEIDVHRTFVAGPFGMTVDLEELFTGSVQLPLPGADLRALIPERQFLHACYHVALGSLTPRWVPMRDVAEMLLHRDGVDLEDVVSVAARWRAGIVVQRAVLCTWDAFDLPGTHPFQEWARRYRPTAFERRALAAYIAPNRSYATQAIAGLHAVRGVRAKCAYAGALLIPSREYARERGGYVGRLRRGVATARSMRARQ
jgi:hypothetical protein